MASPTPSQHGNHWTRLEVEAVVADYFQMLTFELSGQQYSKSVHRRGLITKLNDRSEGSVELKHQNISAVLIDLSAPWIVGYKPRKNYQRLLFDVVAERLEGDRGIDEVASAAVEQQAVTPIVESYVGFLVPAPHYKTIGEPAVATYKRRTVGVRRDYLGQEARNRSLGAAGEAVVVGYERHRLHELGAKRLVDRVEQVSITQGDGLGYDVLSFDPDGKERFIEVKTTAFGPEAPFYVTKTELELSKAAPDLFRLYRLFEFRHSPRMFEMTGVLGVHCGLEPISYLATFA